MEDDSKDDVPRSRSILLWVLLAMFALALIFFLTVLRPVYLKRQMASEFEQLDGHINFQFRRASEPRSIRGYVSWVASAMGESISADASNISLRPRTADDLRLIQNFPEVKSLHLKGDAVTDELLATLNGLQNVEQLSFADARLGDHGAATLTQFSMLNTLHFTRCTLPAELLETLTRLKGLRSLTFEDCVVAEDDLPMLGGAKSSLRLDITATPVSESSLLALHQANPTWTISFSPMKGRSDNSIALPSAAAMASTTALTLRGPLPTDATLKAVQNAQNLKSLQLIECTGLNDNSVTLLKQFSNLEHLEIYRTPLTPAAIQQLREALPRCKIYTEP